jgi:signal transduction histidine kinase
MYADEVESIVTGRDAADQAVCDTVPVNRAEIADRWNAGVAALRRPTSPPPRLSGWAWTADAILALVLAVGVVDGALNRDSGVPAAPAGVPVPPAAAGSGPDPLLHHYGPAAPWQLILAALTALPLVARRRCPLVTFWLVIGASQLYHLSPGFDPMFTFTACVIAACSAAMYSSYQVLATASALLGAGLIVGEHKASVPSIRPGLVTFLFLVLVGLAIYTWKQRVRVLEAEQEAATRLALDRERSRIAQELHDVVTHNVSMMVVQAGAARKVMAAVPEKAHEALLAVESGGRAAMTELRHVMCLLTMNNDNPDQIAAEEDLAPPPGLGQVMALAARVRDTGVPVELSVTGPPAPLSAGMDLAAYRVVQEALTNTVKHAVGARVKITIDHAPRALRVEVTDTGGTPAASGRSGNGRGLIGLKERLAVYGGTLEAGKQPTGGYRVRAVFPLEEP